MYNSRDYCDMKLVFTSLFFKKISAYIDTSDWEFPDVCKYYFGRLGQWSSLLFSMVSLLGAMVVYWVLMSNFLFNTGKFIYSKQPLCHATYVNSLIHCGLDRGLSWGKSAFLFTTRLCSPHEYVWFRVWHKWNGQRLVSVRYFSLGAHHYYCLPL